MAALGRKLRWDVWRTIPYFGRFDNACRLPQGIGPGGSAPICRHVLGSAGVLKLGVGWTLSNRKNRP